MKELDGPGLGFPPECLPIKYLCLDSFVEFLMVRQKKVRASVEGEVSDEDRISELPDDILFRILSILTSKEVGRMSVLSKKWIHAWLYNTTLDFNFQCSASNDMLKRGRKLLQLQQRVEQVISLHKAPTIDELRLRFDVPLNYPGKQSIDDLLRFAVEKGVKRLEMDFSWYPRIISSILIRFTFPSLSCNSLTSLELSGVDITGEVLESYLCNSLALECLSVNDSRSLVELKVSGPLLKLKTLSITAWKLRRLEICAPVLESFCYSGVRTNVVYTSVPKLVQLSFDFPCGDFLSELGYGISSILTQIEVLSLNAYNQFRFLRIVEGSMFTRLKKLDVHASPNSNDNLYCIISLIHACPSLQHFELKLDMPSNCKNKLIKWEGYPHNLKNVKIVGFVGKTIDLEFAVYLVENGVSLYKMIVDTRKIHSSGNDLKVTQSRRLARARAEQLIEYCKPGTQLVIS